MHEVRGFSLIELLLYVATLSIMLLSISVFLGTLLESRVKNQTIAEVEQQGLQAMQIITQTVRNAASIVGPATSTTSSTLTLATYAATTTPTVFNLAESVMQIIESTTPPVALTNNRILVSDLLFSNFSRTSTPGVVQIQFTIQHVTSTGKSEYTFSKTFYGSAALRFP